MTNKIQVFNFEQMNVRTVDIDNEVWFVAADVANALGLTNVSVSLKSLDEDERSKFNLGRQGLVNVISEPGLYSFIGSSRKPEAKRFMRWVNHEVLPSIRQTGSYQAQPSFRLPQNMQEMTMMVGNLMGEQKAEIDEVKSQVDYLISEQTLNSTDYNAIAKAVSRTAHSYGRDHHIPEEKHGALIHDLNSQVLKIAGVRSRTRIKAHQFDEVMTFIERDWMPTSAVLVGIRQTELEM